MIPAFVAILVVYALALAAVCAWSTIRGTGPARWQLAWTMALEAGLIVQAVIAAVLVARGDGPDRSEVVIGYLLTSVIVLPAVALYARRGGTRWDSLMLGITALVLAVVIGRLGMTWAEGT
jgi:hypothetical protein